MGLRDENAKLQKRIEELEFERSRNMHRIGELEEGLQQNYKRTEELKAEVSTLRADKVLMGKQLGAANEKITHIQRESDTRYARLVEAEKQVLELTGQNGELTEANCNIATGILDLSAAVRSLSAD